MKKFLFISLLFTMIFSSKLFSLAIVEQEDGLSFKASNIVEMLRSNPTEEDKRILTLFLKLELKDLAKFTKESQEQWSGHLLDWELRCKDYPEQTDQWAGYKKLIDQSNYNLELSNRWLKKYDELKQEFLLD